MNGFDLYNPFALFRFASPCLRTDSVTKGTDMRVKAPLLSLSRKVAL